MAKIYIHIGCEKTGGSTIQSCFDRYERELFKDDECYPSELFRRPNHMELSSLVLPSEYLVNMMVPVSKSDFRNALFEYLWNNTDRNIYLSSEHLLSRVVDVDKIRKLLSILTIAGHKPVILAFYREPLKWIYSHYRQYVSCGGFLSFPDYIKQSNREGFIADTTNFGRALFYWSEVASMFDGCVRYRSYEASAADLLKNFCSMADLVPLPGMEKIVANPSMTNSQVTVQRWVNFFLRKRRITDYVKKVITNVPLPSVETNWHMAYGLEEYCGRQEAYIARLGPVLSRAI